MKRMTEKRYFKETGDERYSVEDCLHARDASLLKTIIEFGPCDSNLYYAGELVDRLAAYENTGLEPEEIEKLAIKNHLNNKFGVESAGQTDITEIIELAMSCNASVIITEMDDGTRMISICPLNEEQTE